MIDVNSTNETVLCAPWVVFASGRGLRGEYGTTASTGVDSAQEQEVCALCRAFHNSIGVQEVPDDAPVLLFWKARKSSHWIITQVLRAPLEHAHSRGQRIAYEYFSLVLTEADLRKLGGNPLRAIDLVRTEAWREAYASGLQDPICAPLVERNTTPNGKAAPPAQQFSQNGTWPATEENRRALLTFIGSNKANIRTFATWWPGAQPPPVGFFDLVLRSDETRVARPHEIIATATELSQLLSRSLPAPPSYDASGARNHRALLLDADEVQKMLNEAYFPASLEESPHRWMTRPQKAAGLCQKIADALPDYSTRLPAPLDPETVQLCADLADRYQTFADELLKLRHPNLLHQRGEATAAGPATPVSENQLSNSPGMSRKGMQIALIVGGLLVLCLFGFGVRSLFGESKMQRQPAAQAIGTSTQRGATSGFKKELSDEQALAVMRARAEQEVFRVARTLAAQRATAKNGLSKDAIRNTVVDAVAQAMSQTPYSQIRPSQKTFLFRMATEPIRVRAMDGVKAGAQQRGSLPHTSR